MARTLGTTGGGSTRSGRVSEGSGRQGGLGLQRDLPAQLPEALRKQTTALTNGETRSVSGVSIEAVPMYNTTLARAQFHTKGRGNGYVITLGGTGEVEVAGGVKITDGPGTIVLVEDTTGKGHITRTTGTEDHVALWLPLADQSGR